MEKVTPHSLSMFMIFCCSAGDNARSPLRTGTAAGITDDPVDEEVCLFGGEVFQNPEKAFGIPHLLIGAKVRALILELG